MAIRILSAENISGALTVSGALTITGTSTLNGGLKVIGPGSYNTIRSANDYTLGFLDNAGTSQWWIKAYTNGSFALHENGVGDQFTIAAGGAATFAGTAIFDGDMTLPAAADNFLIGASGLATTGKIKFGDVSWNNSIGLESYWMVMRSNQNEGYKFIDSAGSIYVQLNAGNNSAGANYSYFKGRIGIGKTAAKTLDVEGNIRAINTGGSAAAEIDISSGATWRLRSNPTSGTNSYGLDIIKGGAGTDVKMSIASDGVTTIGMTNNIGSAEVRIGGTGNATGNGTGRLNFVNSSSYRSWQLLVGGSAAGGLAFNQSVTFGSDDFTVERMRITAAGAIEIKGAGTTVNGNAFITNTNTVTTFGSTQSSGVPKDMAFFNGAERMRIKATTGNVGIGTDAPIEKLQVEGGAYINGRDIGKGVNLATSQGWTALTAGNVNSVLGYFGGNFSRNGASNENEIIWGTNYADQRSLIWKSTNNNTGSDDDGGWNKGITTGNDNVGYMSYVYVKRTNASTNGSFYFGCSGGNTLNLAGTAIGNPYFQAVNIGTLPLNVWCLAIGHIQANNDSNTINNGDTGIFRVDTGVKLYGGTSFKMGTNGGGQSHRTYLYYSTDPVSTLSWVDPGFYAIDGTQPTMAELFDTGTPSAGGSSPWTTTGNDIYYTTGEVGINNTTPGSFGSDNNQLVVGSGSGRQGITIYSATNGESSIRFTSTVTTFTNDMLLTCKQRDSQENNYASLIIQHEFNELVKFVRQGNDSQIPKVKLGYNNPPTQDDMDQSMLQIAIPSSINNPGIVIYGDSNGNDNPYLAIKHTGNNNYDTPRFIKFYNYSGSVIGQVQQNFNSNSVSYSTSSDYRLKDNLKPFKALDIVSNIKVYNFHWIGFDDKANEHGVLAHELQELIPEAVSGEKDKTKDDGSIDVQQVDYSRIIPHLIQSIQDLKSEVDKLKKQIL